jgi:hypothetical protein
LDSTPIIITREIAIKKSIFGQQWILSPSLVGFGVQSVAQLTRGKG